MTRPIHFEILADDPEHLVEFYAQVFGWQAVRWEGGEQDYWPITTGPDDQPGINGGIMGRHFEQSVINTVETPSLEQTTQLVESAGGKLVHGPNEVPGAGTHAYFADPEGNLFGVMQPVESEER
jgi:predicted enzyme related to lactoylglutathione lyase